MQRFTVIKNLIGPAIIKILSHTQTDMDASCYFNTLMKHKEGATKILWKLAKLRITKKLRVMVNSLIEWVWLFLRNIFNSVIVVELYGIENNGAGLIQTWIVIIYCIL